MRVLILAPFTEEALSDLQNVGIETVHESWLETDELQDPEVLGPRLARERRLMLRRD